MSIILMDCTLRDGANVVGKGFPAEITDMVLDNLTACRVPIIEFGNAGGIGAYEVAGYTAAETDQTYLKIGQKYLNRGSELGMFLNAKRYREKNVYLAKECGLSFLRVGTDAGDAATALDAIKTIKATGMKAYYSLMKAYLLTPDQLAEEGKKLQEAGLDQITIMDSAGTMMPDEAAEYTRKLVNAVSIPVAFHCHNNLGMSAANAIAAYENGASVLDCGLMGMARSAGNLPTEICVAIMQRKGEMLDMDLYRMLDCVERLSTLMRERYDYHNPISPFDLILGISGMHSGFSKVFREVSAELKVPLFQLVVEVSKQNRKNPNEDLIRRVAARMRG